MHVSCMLERADRLARGHTDLRSCVACSCERAGGRRPIHLAELARGLPMTESGGRWAALRNTMQCADLLQRDVPGPGPASYLTTGVHGSFEFMVRSQWRIQTFSFLLCSLLSDALGLPQATYLDFPRSRELEVAVGRYRALFRRVRDPIAGCPAPVNKRVAIHLAQRPRILPSRKERLTRWTLRVLNVLERKVPRSLPFRWRRRLRR